MPPPPPPPPPGPGPPGPPPPRSSRNALPDRKGLLGDIAKGKQLKKAVTNDRSAPQVGGGVISSTSGASSLGRPPVVPSNHGPGPSSQTDNHSPSAPQLGGLFAGGMPTLRKTSRATGNPSDSEQFPNSNTRDRGPPTIPANNTAPGPSRLPPKAPLTRPSAIAEPPSIVRSIGIPPPPPAPPALPTSNAPLAPPPPPPPPVPAAKLTNGTKGPAPAMSIPSRPAPGDRSTTQKSSENLNANTARLPSLPTAPPPPLPSTASPAPPMPRGPAPVPVAMMQSPSTAAATQFDTAPSTTRTQSARPTSNASAFDGLQAALADRGSNRASHSSIENMSHPESSIRQNSENGFDSAAYSLKAQRVKRVDDSRYKFQPDNALPIIRPFTNCQKHYRSGRSQGSTVPLNLSELR